MNPGGNRKEKYYYFLHTAKENKKAIIETINLKIKEQQE